MSDGVIANQPVLTAEEALVTPLMVEAGVDVLSSNYLSLEGGLELFPEIVRSVYLAMREAKVGYLQLDRKTAEPFS